MIWGGFDPDLARGHLGEPGPWLGEPKQPKKRKSGGSGWARERRLKKEKVELASAVRETFVSKVAQEMKDEFKQELKDELREEVRDQMKNALKLELLAEIQASLTSNVAAQKNR